MTGECHNDIIIAQNIPLSLRRHQDDVSMFVKLWQPANKIPVGNSFICFREILVSGGASITFIYLKGSQELIKRRLEERANHYFKAELLQSQFDTLEVSHTIKWYIPGNFYFLFYIFKEPIDTVEGSITVDCSQSLETVVKVIRKSLLAI